MGGPGSHTAIVAEALEIPAVVGVGPFLTDVSGGDMVIIDGRHGVVILQPDEETIARYRHEVEQEHSVAQRLESLRDLPAETADGVPVELWGNIEFPHEVDHCLERGADRHRPCIAPSSSTSPPKPSPPKKPISKPIRTSCGRWATSRWSSARSTSGADKLAQLPTPEEERNPVLGLRSIRMSLRNLPMFRTQLRAILRVSAWATCA